MEIPHKLFVVGFSGPQGAGKSWLTKRLQSGCIDSSFVCQCDSLAKPMYDFWRLVLGAPIDKQQTYGIGMHEPREFTGRALLQFLGTEVGRQIHQELWVWSIVRRNVELAAGRPMILLIDDVRFMNERQICHLHVWLNAENLPQQAANHDSERDQQELRQSANLRLWRTADGRYLPGECGEELPDEEEGVQFEEQHAIITLCRRIHQWAECRLREEQWGEGVLPGLGA